MSTVDPQQQILNLLSDNWNIANTNSATPIFSKITDKKRYNFRKNPDVIFAHVNKPEKKPAGIGTVARHDIERFDLDIRSIGKTNETHWRRVIDETRRILDTNIISPTTPFDLLNSDFPGQNLSNQLHHVWRMLIPIELTNFVQTRSAIPIGP